MSNIDKQALREATTKAMLEEGLTWWDEAQLKDGVVLHQADAAFVAIANPATVLALLDELEAKDRRNAELNSTLERWATDRAQSASELEDSEKRISELEAREVREEGNQFLVVRHPGKAPVIKHCAGDLEGFLRELLEQDPLATIDIVTHRYYGVGGQWVQDADEYLQMMDAAGRINGEG